MDIGKKNHQLCKHDLAENLVKDSYKNSDSEVEIKNDETFELNKKS